MTGSISWGTKPSDSHLVRDTKQSEEPESIKPFNRELNPDAIFDTTSGDLVKQTPGSGPKVSGRRDDVETSIYKADGAERAEALIVTSRGTLESTQLGAGEEESELLTLFLTRVPSYR